MKKHLIFALACMALIFTACEGGSSDATSDSGQETGASDAQETRKATEMDFQSAFTMDNNSKFVSIEGYLQLPSMMFSFGESQTINFSQRPGQRSGDEISVSLSVGKCKNCMDKLAEEYDLDDLKVTANDGETIIKANQRVRITGKLTVRESPGTGSPSNLAVSLEDFKIEKVAEVELDYAAMEPLAVTAANLFDTTLISTFSVVKGKIELPFLLYMKDDVSLDIPIGKKKISVNFLFGEGPNNIEALPDDYSKNDIKIHDYQGKIIDIKKPVTIYGMRTTPTKDDGGTIYVERVEQ